MGHGAGMAPCRVDQDRRGFVISSGRTREGDFLQWVENNVRQQNVFMSLEAIGTQEAPEAPWICSFVHSFIPEIFLERLLCVRWQEKKADFCAMEFLLQVN